MNEASQQSLARSRLALNQDRARLSRERLALQQPLDAPSQAEHRRALAHQLIEDTHDPTILGRAPCHDVKEFSSSSRPL